MTKLLKEIVEELATVEITTQGPQYELEDDDHTVGVMNEELKKLFVLRDKLRRAAERAELHAKLVVLDSKEHTEDVERDPEFIRTFAKYALAVTKHHTADDLLWASLRYEFPETIDKSVGIRRNWQVVWTEKSREENVLDNLEDIFKHLHLVPGNPRKKSTLQ